MVVQLLRLVRAHKKLLAEFARKAKAEEALRDEHRRLRHVLEICERDQRLLACEIHDGFVQTATAALMNLQAGLAAQATDPQKALENVARGLELLQEGLSQVRRLIGGLRPVALEDQGLVAAVDQLVRDAQGLVAAVNQLVRDAQGRTEIPIGWSHQVQFERLDPLLEMSLFRIIQEALANALRHSRTARVEIALTQSGGNVHVRIQDWGCGFDASVRKPDHFGLQGMQERARLFGGAVGIRKRAPGEGTCVTAEFPL